MLANHTTLREAASHAKISIQAVRQAWSLRGFEKTPLQERRDARRSAVVVLAAEGRTAEEIASMLGQLACKTIHNDAARAGVKLTPKPSFYERYGPLIEAAVPELHATLTISQLAVRLGISEGAVGRYLNRHKISLGRRGQSPGARILINGKTRSQIACALVTGGMTPAQAAREVGLSRVTVLIALRRLAIAQRKSA
jgi:DNA-binding CsgD family transcriptional regulator